MVCDANLPPVIGQCSAAECGHLGRRRLKRVVLWEGRPVRIFRANVVCLDNSREGTQKKSAAPSIEARPRWSASLKEAEGNYYRYRLSGLPGQNIKRLIAVVSECFPATPQCLKDVFFNAAYRHTHFIGNFRVRHAVLAMQNKSLAAF